MLVHARVRVLQLHQSEETCRRDDPEDAVLCSRETNLKVKQALTVTGEMGDATEVLARFKGQRSPPAGRPPVRPPGVLDVDAKLLWQVRSSASPPTTAWTSSGGT